jgi:hypothetical protein
MSNCREHIKNLTYLVNDGLTAYITIHDKIFRESGTFKSFLKNIFGRAVPMSQLLQDAETLVPLWNGISEKIILFGRDANFPMDENERYYFEVLGRYTQAVSETVDALVKRQGLLNQRSKGGQDNSVSWDIYQDAERTYQSAIQKYMAIGQELNNTGHLVFS